MSDSNGSVWHGSIFLGNLGPEEEVEGKEEEGAEMMKMDFGISSSSFLFLD